MLPDDHILELSYPHDDTLFKLIYNFFLKAFELLVSIYVILYLRL